MLDDERLQFILADEGEPQRACQLMIDAANEAGGKDNITAIVIDVLT